MFVWLNWSSSVARIVANESFFSVCPQLDGVVMAVRESLLMIAFLFSVFLNAFYMFCEIKGNSQIKLISIGITVYVILAYSLPL